MKQIPSPLDIEIAAKRAGKTMGQVCAEAGIQHSTFSHWKRKKTRMSIETLQKIIAVLAEHL